MTRMIIYRNSENQNKYLDIRQRKDGRIYARQFMRWSSEDSASRAETVNPTGDARLHRVHKRHVEDITCGYEPIWTSMQDVTYRWIQKGLVGRYIKVKRRVNDYA